MSKLEVAKQIDAGINEGLNLQEISWCETYLRTASIRQACKEALIDLSSAKKMLDKPIVQAYILSKATMYKGSEDNTLTRSDLKKILNNIASDATTPPELRLNAISKLNFMLEFDSEHKDQIIDDNQEEIKLTADEAEEMLRKMRNKEKV